MPTKSKELLDRLHVDASAAKRAFPATQYGSDPAYGEGVKKGILFPPLLTYE